MLEGTRVDCLPSLMQQAEVEIGDHSRSREKKAGAAFRILSITYQS